MTNSIKINSIAAAVGLLAYLGTTVACWNFIQRPHVSLGSDEEATPLPKQPSMASLAWNADNSEIEQLIAELKKEKAGLAEREKQLKELETRLQTERSEINLVTQSLEKMQKDFDTEIVRVKQQEQPNLKRLGKTYATMSPEGAAGILKEMDDPAIVKILVMMKDAESAPILEAFSKLGPAESKRAAAISDRIRLSMPNPTPTKRTP